MIRELEEDAEKLESEGNYYKVLKRLFSIYVLESNQNKLHYLTSVFNSPLGASYEKICNMKAMELVYEGYKDNSVEQKMKQNLKLMGASIRIGSIEEHIKMCDKELNAEAKQQLQELATQ